MLYKTFILSLFISVSFATAQNVVKEPVVVRNEDFKKGLTFEAALAQVYKKIVPKKSTKKLTPCFWMLGDKKYLMVDTPLKYEQGHDKLEIEPMIISKLEKLQKDGAVFLVNKTERVNLVELNQCILAYTNLAKANDSEPIFQVSSSNVDVNEGITMLKKIHEFGIKRIYLVAPVKRKEAPPAVPLPKKRPASPHKK